MIGKTFIVSAGPKDGENGPSGFNMVNDVGKIYIRILTIVPHGIGFPLISGASVNQCHIEHFVGV